MAGDTSVCNAKNILEVLLGLTYLLNLNYEKSAKCNPTFRRDKFFRSFPNFDKSVSTQRFSQKREKISVSLG